MQIKRYRYGARTTVKAIADGPATIGCERNGVDKYFVTLRAAPHAQRELLQVVLTESELRAAVDDLDRFKGRIELERRAARTTHTGAPR